MKINIAIEGTVPVLMHNSQLANPRNAIVREMKGISGKRKKSDDDLDALARLEFEGGLYFDSQFGPYIPGVMIERSIQAGGKITKQGKQIERALFVTENVNPLIYRGPRTVEELWSDEQYVHSAVVRVGTSRIVRIRPMFRQWRVETIAEFDNAVMNLEDLRRIATDAGNMCGIGDYRPTYGRYTIEIS